MLPAMQRLKSRVVAAAAVVALAAGVAVADGAVRTGKYTGKHRKGGPVSFKVSKKGKSKRISNFRFSKLTLRCSDGQQFVPEGGFGSGRKRLRMGRKGRFTVFVQYVDGGNWTARGRIKGRKATGTVRLRVRFNPSADPDGDDVPAPNGRIRCDSGKVKFSARRRR
jgi:hypothetical protein